MPKDKYYCKKIKKDIKININKKKKNYNNSKESKDKNIF